MPPSHLLPPNLSSILVANNIFRNMGISESCPHTYMNRYIYKYIDQIFLFSKVIKSHYQETNKQNPQKPQQQPKKQTCCQL